jgi:hypothetical protein
MYNWVGLWHHMNPVPDTTIEKILFKGIVSQDEFFLRFIIVNRYFLFLNIFPAANERSAL